MYDVRDITNLILDTADERQLPITNLSLQKLLYFIHGWFFAIFEEPLIKSKFEAWQYGPVQRVIYNQFKVCKDQPIRGIRATYIDPETGENVYRPPAVKLDHLQIILQVLEKYEKFSAGQLVEQSHIEDGPWEYVWQQAEEVVYPGMRIPDAMILDHFRRLNPILSIH